MSPSPQHESVSVDQIDLDTDNPRIAHALSSYTPPYTAEQVYLALNSGGSDEEAGTATTFNRLKQSIQSNKGISQPVHLRKAPGGRFVSVEGNTRVAIYKEFKKKAPGGIWDRIPAFVYDDLDETSLHAIRLQAHLVGPRPWDPYSKAKYLYHLRNDKGYAFAHLVDLCGGNKRSIQESLDAYDDMEKYFRPILAPGEIFDTTRFSGFVELQKQGIKQVLQQAGYTVADFAAWIHDKKIERLADVRSLPRVLRDPRAREVFIREDIESARKTLELPELGEALQKATLVALCRALTQAIGKLEYSEHKKLKRDLSAPNVQDIAEALLELRGLAEDLGLPVEDD